MIKKRIKTIQKKEENKRKKDKTTKSKVKI